MMNNPVQDIVNNATSAMQSQGSRMVSQGKSKRLTSKDKEESRSGAIARRLAKAKGTSK